MKQAQDLLKHVNGWQIAMRLVTVDDADYILDLRKNPKFNGYLSAVTGDVAGQRTWIETYKDREAKEQELYYIIMRSDGERCGLVRLYEITDETFTWGSWILDDNKPTKAALESAVLIYQIGFEILRRQRAVFEVDLRNSRTLAFHDRFSAKRTGKDDVNAHFVYDAADFARGKQTLIPLLETAAASANLTHTERSS